MFRLCKLTGVTAVAVFLGFTATAFAAGIRHTAVLHGVGEDPRASGAAVWQVDARKITLTMQVENVSSCTLAAVFVDGQLVGIMDIVDGAGALKLTSVQSEATGDVPRVHPGSIITVFDALIVAERGTDLLGPCLVGTFRGE